jgi:tripartite-type tricarboxylate transporter receptor subunit TctC
MRGQRINGHLLKNSSIKFQTMSNTTDFDTPGWVALYAPKGLPAPIVIKLQDAIAKVLAQPDVISRFAASGAQAKFMNASDLNAYEAAETRKWSEAVKYSGAKID